jgi:FAD/FMN-containing dehydrogenase
MPPARYDIALDMSTINQIAHYDPGDLTLSADAGCTLENIAAALTPQNQFLPLPTAFGRRATIAGAIASGVDSPLRQFYGTARDFLIGAEFVDGTGAQCKSGGRVVKNVTGYDLHKLLIGSLGTLAVITRLNFRTFPSLTSGATRSETFYARFRDGKSAVAFRQKIAASPFTPYAIEIIDPEMARILSKVPDGPARKLLNAPPAAGPDPAPAADPDNRAASDDQAANYVQMEWFVAVFFHGTAELLQRYTATLCEFAESAGATLFSNLEADIRASQEITSRLPQPTASYPEPIPFDELVFDALHHLRDTYPAATIFKIAQLPAKLPDLFAALGHIANQAQLPHVLFAHGIGITYFALILYPFGEPYALDNPATVKRVAQAAQEIFAECSRQSATATIQFAPTTLKRQLNVFGPERSDAPAMRRLKSAFDPHNLFAPGRMLQVI